MSVGGRYQRGPATMAARRDRIRRLVALGKRVGYLCFAAAVVLFFVGFAARFTPALTGVIVALMVVGCFVLPPAIVFSYGLRAAEREEREEQAAREAREPRGPREPAEPGPRRDVGPRAGDGVSPGASPPGGSSGASPPGAGPTAPGTALGQPGDQG